MSDFETMAACMLPHEPVANNEASAKSDRNNVLEASALSIVRGRTRKNLDLCFYDQKEFRILSAEDKKTLRDWKESNPEEF